MERLLFFWSQYVFVLIGLVTLELEEEIKKTAFLRFHLQPEMAFHVAHDMIYQLSNLTSAWDSVLTGRELLFPPKYIDWNNPEMSRSYSLLYHWPLALDLINFRSTHSASRVSTGIVGLLLVSPQQPALYLTSRKCCLKCVWRNTFLLRGASYNALQIANVVGLKTISRRKV